jgi:hypothetical protein
MLIGAAMALSIGCGGSSEDTDESTTTTESGTGSETESTTDDQAICERFQPNGDNCVVYVSAQSGENNIGRGHTWAMALAGVREAVELQSQLQQYCDLECAVWVEAGVYAAGDFTGKENFTLDQNDQLFGGFAGSEKHTSERDLANHVTYLTQYIEIDGDAIIDGVHKPEGGVFVKNGSVLLTNMNFTGYGGLKIDGGVVQVRSSFFGEGSDSGQDKSANIEILSGELAIDAITINDYSVLQCSGDGNANISISNSMIRDGGDIRSTAPGCIVNVTSCEFTEGVDASKSPSGPSVSAWENGGVITIEDCFFHDIDFGEGSAAISASIDSSIVVKNTIFHNIKGGIGAVVLNHDGHVELTNVLVYSNAVNNALNNNYGVILGESEEGTARFKIRNSIFANSTPACFGDNPFMGDAKYDISYSILESEDFTGEGVLYTPAMFVDSKNDDFRLAAGSPGIDAADGSAAPALDKDGKARVDDPAVANTGTGTPDYADMGPFERQP